MKRWLLLALLLLVAVGAGWAFGSPQLALWQMRKAAEARDVDALSRHIDYPSVRESVKAQLAERMQGGERSAFGALVAAGLADRLVDAAVSPDGMRLVFAAAPLAGAAGPGTIRLKAENMNFRRNRWDEFRLVPRDGKGGALVFRLHGLAWKLSDIELPPDALH